MSITIESKEIWFTYTGDEYGAHPLFAVLWVAREDMKIVRGVFKHR